MIHGGTQRRNNFTTSIRAACIAAAPGICTPGPQDRDMVEYLSHFNADTDTAATSTTSTTEADADTACYEADLHHIQSNAGCDTVISRSFVCSGPLCAGMIRTGGNQSTALQCAFTTGEAGSVPSPSSGRCAPLSHVGETLAGFGVIGRNDTVFTADASGRRCCGSLQLAADGGYNIFTMNGLKWVKCLPSHLCNIRCRRDARRPAIVLKPDETYFVNRTVKADRKAPITFKAAGAQLIDIGIDGFPDYGVHLSNCKACVLSGLDIRNNLQAGVLIDSFSTNASMRSSIGKDFYSFDEKLKLAAPALLRANQIMKFEECAVTEQQRNVVVNNGGGVLVDSQNVKLDSLFIGVEIDGTTANGNGLDGLHVWFNSITDSAHAVVGLDAAALGLQEQDYNAYSAILMDMTKVVVANNKRDGIRVCGRATINTVFIGVNANGITAAGNEGSGIRIGCNNSVSVHQIVCELSGCMWLPASSKCVSSGAQPECDKLSRPYEKQTTVGVLRDASQDYSATDQDQPSISRGVVNGGTRYLPRVVVAGNAGDGITAGAHRGEVFISHTNVGVGSDGRTLIGNAHNGIHIATQTGHPVVMDQVTVVANGKNGIRSKDRIKLADSNIGVLRGCTTHSWQFLDANLGAGNQEYGLYLDAYADDPEDDRNELGMAVVSNTAFVNNKLGGIYSHGLFTLSNTSVGKDICDNVHLEPQRYGVVVHSNFDDESFSTDSAMGLISKAINVGSVVTIAYGEPFSRTKQQIFGVSIRGERLMVVKSMDATFLRMFQQLDPTTWVNSFLGEGLDLDLMRYNSSVLDWYDNAKFLKGKLTFGDQGWVRNAPPSTTTTIAAATPRGGGGDGGAGTGVDGVESSARSVAAGVAVSLVLLVAIVLGVFFLRRRQRSLSVARARLFHEVADAANIQFARNYRHLRQHSATADSDTIGGMLISACDVMKQNQIGDGRRSIVFAGEMHVPVGDVAAAAATQDVNWANNDQHSPESTVAHHQQRPQHRNHRVAVKQLRMVAVPGATGENISLSSALQFLEEALLLTNLDHPNCLRVVGIVETPDPFTILTQYCANGSLKLFLRACRPALANPRARLTPEILSQTASKVVAGMVYLSSKSIVHRALAAHSIMVGDTIDDIKLSRFGRSRDVYMSDEYISTAPAAATSSEHTEFVRWMSPEAVRDQAFSYASDVWSAAVVFYEIFTFGRIPHGVSKTAEIVRAIQADDFALPSPANCPDRIYAIMRECWQQGPSQRPSFHDLEAWLSLVHHGNSDALFQTYDDAHTVCLPEKGFLEELHQMHCADITSGGGNRAAGVPLESLAVRRSGLVRLKTLGSGEFGLVELMAAAPGMFGVGQPAQQVAVKVLSGTGAGLQDAFMQEARLMCKCRHPALVSILGVCIEAQPQYMVLEYLPGGSLEDWMHQHHARVQLQHQAVILYQVAIGMAKLGALGIVHRDLAARNVLVGSGLVVKICDFGLSREGKPSRGGAEGGAPAAEEAYYRLQSKDTPLPLRWLAPEVLLNGMRFSAHTDVYSFGIVLWETFSLHGNEEKPFLALSNQEVAMLLGNQSGMLLHPSLPMPFGLGHPLAQMLVDCVSRHPSVRPTFSTLAESLLEIALAPPLPLTDGDGGDAKYLSVESALLRNLAAGGHAGGSVPVTAGGYAMFNNANGSADAATHESAL